MMATKKLSSSVEIDFPQAEPSFKLKIGRLSIGEEAFLQETALTNSEVAKAGDRGLVTFGRIYGQMLLGKIKEKLLDWESSDYPFSQENKDIFFDSLNRDQRTELVNLYQNKLRDDREAAMGNGSMLVKDSSKHSKGDKESPLPATD